MQLARVAVRNVRSYPRAELALGPGTTLIVGDVGAGKTSLLYAVEMALFGFAEFDASYLVRHGARDAEVVLTLADGSHTYVLERKFRRREIKGRPTFQLESSAYSEDGVTRRYSATELKQRVIELLGFPDNPNPRAHSDLWRWAVYVPQEAMREILDQDPSRRLETVRKALGLEQYRIARENAQLVAAELGRRAERHTDQAGELARSAGEVERWAGEVATATAGLELARSERPGVATAIAAADDEIVKIEALRQRELSLLAERTSLTRRLDETERGISQRRTRLAQDEARQREMSGAAEQLTAVEATLREISTSVRAAEAQRDRARESREQALRDHRAFSAAEGEARTLRENLVQSRADQDRSATEALRAGEAVEALRNSAADAPRETPPDRGAAELLRERETVEARERELARHRAVAEAELAELQTLQREGVCPRCHQTVRPDEFRVHVSEVETDVAASRDGLARTAAERTAIEADLHRWDAIDRQQQELAHRAEMLQVAEAESRRAGQRVAEIARRARELESSLSETEAIVARLRAVPARAELLARELDAADRRVRELTEELSHTSQRRALLIEQLSRQAQVERDLLELRSELAQRERERDETRRQREELDRADASIATEVARLPLVRATKDRLEDQRADIDQRIGRFGRALQHASESRAVAVADAARRSLLLGEAAEERSIADWFADAFRDSLARLEQRLLVRAQQEFQRDFARFFRALVDDPALQARCDATFAPAVEIDGEWTPPEALSGGERTALALAYRLALGAVVRSFGELTLATLILDEPTDGFSPEQVSRMGELLDELALPQVVLVSHEPSLASVADRVVRIRKVDGVSEIEGEVSAPPPVRSGPTATPPPVPGERPPRSARRARRTLDEVAR